MMLQTALLQPKQALSARRHYQSSPSLAKSKNEGRALQESIQGPACQPESLSDDRTGEQHLTTFAEAQKYASSGTPRNWDILCGTAHM
jgi:hypothetical protein